MENLGHCSCAQLGNTEKNAACVTQLKQSTELKSGLKFWKLCGGGIHSISFPSYPLLTLIVGDGRSLTLNQILHVIFNLRHCRPIKTCPMGIKMWLIYLIRQGIKDQRTPDYYCNEGLKKKVAEISCLPPPSLYPL